MIIQELCFIALDTKLPQQALAVLSEAPPRQQSLLDRQAEALHCTPWSISIGERQHPEGRLRLFAVAAQHLSTANWLADWLFQRSHLTVLIIDGEQENPEQSLRALLSHTREDQQFSVLVHAKQPPDTQQMARCYATLRKSKRVSVIEWMDVFSSSPQDILQRIYPANPEWAHLVA